MTKPPLFVRSIRIVRAIGNLGPGRTPLISANAEQFLAECGWQGPLRLRLDRPDAGPTCRELHLPFVVIGRDAGSGLFLDHPDVSRRHAYLQAIAGRVFCVDLLSRTGTHWDGTPRPWGWLSPGKGVRIGPMIVGHSGETDTGPDGDEALPTSRSFGLPSAEEMALELLDHESEPLVWRLSRSMVLLGRSPSCKVHLPGSGCSAFHASLVRTAGGTWVVDLLGAGGTLVNEAAVRCARLGDGDEIRVGSQRLRMHCGPSAVRLLATPNLPARRKWAVTSQVAAPSPGPIPSARRAGPTADQADLLLGQLDGPLVLELLREMSRQQSETTEQFRQAILMMFQMHQEQMNLVAGELDRLRRIVESRPALPLRADGVPDIPRGPSATETTTEASLAAADARPGSQRPSLADPFGPPEAPAGATRLSNGDASGDYHLVIARRLAEAQKDGQGRMLRLLESLTRGGRGESPS